MATVTVSDSGGFYDAEPDGFRRPTQSRPPLDETVTISAPVSIAPVVLPPRDRQHGPILAWFSRLGRWLRFVAGVDERVMDRVKYLRAWYASLGAAVLMTGTIAAFSMWFAVQQATDAHPVVAVMPALVWFLFIVVMDRWIVSARAGEGWQRFILLVTRGGLALLFGIVIAEPLVLKVFENQILQHVEASRSGSLNAIASRYVACNPDPVDSTAEPVPSDCVRTGHDLGIAAALAAQERQLNEFKDQEVQLRETLASGRVELARLQQAAMNECAGASGPGLTGIYGEGINCRRNTDAANAYKASVPWTEQEALLLRLQQQIASLQPTVTDGQRSFTDQRAALIEQRLAVLPQPDEPIGLLERMEVLRLLSERNLSLLVGVWLVRMLFIAIDCSPVLMKIASGKTHYDRWIDGTLDHRVDMHETRLRGKRADAKFEQDIHEQGRKREHEIQQRALRERAVAMREQAYLGRDDDLGLPPIGASGPR